MDRRRAGTRRAREGEKCACGEPAKTVLIRDLGEVPTCVDPDEYASLQHSWLIRDQHRRAAGR